MSLPEPFRVAAGACEAEHRVKGSRFIACASPVTDLTAASECRETERRRFHDATHHVYAVLLRSGERRFDDDGEPSGCAGRPTLAAIERAGLADVVVVVTRYFGGTKLGTGGLGRAYGTAADRVLERVRSRRVVRARRVRILYAYGDTGPIARCVESAGGVRVEERYDQRAALEVAVPVANLEALRRAVREATAGRAELTELPEETLLPFET